MQNKEARHQNIILLVATITGFSALLYEVCWQRYLSNILGSNSRGTTLTLSVFLLGLGIGYLAFGKYTQDKTRGQLIKLYGLAEAFIGIWGILFLTIYSIAWRSIGVLPLEQPIPLLYDFLIILISIGPSTILMGATLPLLTQAFCSQDGDSGREHALLYAVNTAGAGLGALLGGLILLPAIGLFSTNVVAILLNIVFGIYVYTLASQYGDEKVSYEADESTGTGGIQNLGIFCLLAFLVGFIGLALQAFFLRTFGISIGSSEATFGLVVAAYIFLSAIGSWYFAKKRKASLEWIALLLFGSLVVIYFAIPYLPYLFHLIRIQFSSTEGSYYLYYGAIFLAFTTTLALPVATLGSMLPLLVIHTQSREKIGRAVGYIYAANTLGSILGVFCAGFLFFFIMNLFEIYRIIFICSSLLLLITFIGLKTKALGNYKTIALCLGAFILSIALPAWKSRYLSFGLFRERTANKESYLGRSPLYDKLLEGASIIYQNDSADASITIAEFEEDQETTGSAFSRSIIINGKSDGNSLGDRRTMRLIGHLPALLRTVEGPAAVVGFGTGMTVGSLSLYPDIERIDLIEIESATKEFAKYFDFANSNVTKSDKVRWYYQDAYRVFGQSDEKYSLIVSQPSNPWLAGIERLYSVEFHQIVRQRLHEKGIYAHWFPLHDLSAESISLILTTMQKTFPNIRIFKSAYDVLLIASEHTLGEPELAALSRRFSLPKVREELREIGIPSLQYLLAMEQWLSPRLYLGEEVHTLLRPKLGTLARRDFFLNKTARLQLSYTHPKNWFANHQYAMESLLAQWIRNSHDELALTDLLKAGCGSTKIQLVEPNWRYIRSVCRDTAVIALSSKDLTPPQHVEPEFAWLKSFLAGDAAHLRKRTSIQEVIRDFALFAQFDSALRPLSAKKLLWNASLCFEQNTKETMQCRMQLIKTLTFTGRNDLVKSQIESFARDSLGLISQTDRDHFINNIKSLRATPAQ